LLDWTESPYISAFFAMSQSLASLADSAKQNVAVYRLYIKELEPNGLLWKGSKLRLIRAEVDELGRMHEQQGLFTWLESEDFFELEGFLKKSGHLDWLERAIISGDAVRQGLDDLREHGIDYRLLFPDLEGAAKHTNTCVLTESKMF
jgi:hypothetical protein